MEADLAARRGTPADAPLITRIIALAFAADPVWGPSLARLDVRAGEPAASWRPFVDGALRYPSTWLTGGGEAVAIWIPPGCPSMTPEQDSQVREFVTEHLGPAASDCITLLDRLHGSHPTEPHYFLTLLGTRPAHRGRGLGMRLLARNLDLIDAEHQGGYLESSNPANDAGYASLGFEPMGTVSCPAGQVITTMWRPAR